MPSAEIGTQGERKQRSSREFGGDKSSAGTANFLSGPSLPSNGDAEQGLLAACILDQTGETTSLCAESGLLPEHFYSPNHQFIYSALLDLQREGEPADEILLAEKLSQRDQLDEVGGHAALAALTSRIETPAHAPFWLEIVREKQILRQCIRVAHDIIDRANKQEGDLGAFLGEIEKDVFELSQDRASDAAKRFREPVTGAEEQINRLLAGEDAAGVKTGYPDLDNLTNGLSPTEMIVLAARPSVGKTTLAMNIVENIVLSPTVQDDPPSVLVFSLEMSAVSLAMRMICGRAEVNQSDLQRGFAPRDAQTKLAETAREFRQAPIWVDDSGGLTIHQLRAKARRTHSRQPLIVVDYLQLIGTDSRIQSREAGVADISRGLKAMAKELNVPVIVLSQLNRESDKDRREPRLSDLRESGSIEQDADIVMLLAKDKSASDAREMDGPNASAEDSEDFEVIKLILAKQRNGPTGNFQLAFRRQFTRFTSMHGGSRMN
jgi:replicative DNA helicase